MHDWRVRVAQTACFGDVIHLMERGCTFQDSVKQLPSAKRKGWMHALKKFVPFLDSDRILRVGGRFDYMTDLTDEQKCLAFLPKQHKITELFILERHQKLAHRSAAFVL